MNNNIVKASGDRDWFTETAKLNGWEVIQENSYDIKATYKLGPHQDFVIDFRVGIDDKSHCSGRLWELAEVTAEHFYSSIDEAIFDLQAKTIPTWAMATIKLSLPTDSQAAAESLGLTKAEAIELGVIYDLDEDELL